MQNRKLGRREFLHLCPLAGVGALLTACAPVSRQQPTSARPQSPARPEATARPEETAMPEATAMPEEATARIELSGGDAQVWAWERHVMGSLSGYAEDCQAVTVRVNGLDLDATREGERISANVPLAEGENRVVAVCHRADGREDTSNMLTYVQRLRRRPSAVIQASVDAGKLVLDGSESLPAGEDGPPIVRHIWSACQGNPAVVSVQGPAGLRDRAFTGEISGPGLTLTLPPVDGEYTFSLRVVDQAGQDDASTTYVAVHDGQPRIPAWETEHPAWVDSAIAYGVIPRNFGSHGFQSVAEKLDYLQDLGVSVLWLAPVNASPPGDYGYAVTAYFGLNPRYGTKEDFHRMVQEAHARDIRVLMDFVPNHSSEKHPYFQDTLKHGTASPYWDFYDRDETGAPTHYFDWSHLPNLNFDNPEVQHWMIEAFSYWVREFDVDGFRVDVAWGVKERRPDFWPRWRRELKRIKPDLLLLAEASARDPYYFENGFDAAYDWTAQLGHWAWERVFETDTLLTYNLHSALTNQGQGFHPDALIFRFLNNNDTGTRFITTHGLGMTRVATAMLLTLPGIPCIYTGDEVGEAFRPYFDPQPLIWEEKYAGLREYHKKLIGLRKRMPALHSCYWLPLEIEPHQQVYGYVRYLEPADEPALILLNFCDQATEVEIQLPPEFRALAEHPSLLDVLADERVPITGPQPMRAPMPPLSARILVEPRE